MAQVNSGSSSYVIYVGVNRKQLANLAENDGQSFAYARDILSEWYGAPSPNSMRNILKNTSLFGKINIKSFKKNFHY